MENDPISMKIPNGTEIWSFFDTLTKAFFNGQEVTPQKNLNEIRNLINLLKHLHFSNFSLWNMESKIREKNISNKEFVKLKNKMNKTNLYRNTCVERIDEILFIFFNLDDVTSFENLYVNSETLGQIYDSLSILSLKSCYKEKFPRNQKCSLIDIRQNRDYIILCYSRYLSNLSDGKGYMIRYRHFKKYKNSNFSKK